jgi:hypothetical protein
VLQISWHVYFLSWFSCIFDFEYELCDVSNFQKLRLLRDIHDSLRLTTAFLKLFDASPNHCILCFYCLLLLDCYIALGTTIFILDILSLHHHEILHSDICQFSADQHWLHDLC